MKSLLTDDFIRAFRKLPTAVQTQARKNYRLWRANPAHPSLHFKRVHAYEPLYSVRVGLGWRALGLLEEDTITWFWIGSHADYDRMIA
ncbi:MAG TPA: hypothetical protein PKC18_17735 [Lacipirellulaceae bacterium]|nr:hypothetical protein [Lacipirellulaceae bacterium]HMP08279.1 hypothetical protein [Lacipirellulaceae bacterium]